ncbi:MAG: IreB family regulatory phosphoprotein, partial [Oscillospiraceae bacterium]
MNLDYTRKFSLSQDKGDEIRVTLATVYDALKENGYNP